LSVLVIEAHQYKQNLHSSQHSVTQKLVLVKTAVGSAVLKFVYVIQLKKITEKKALDEQIIIRIKMLNFIWLSN